MIEGICGTCKFNYYYREYKMFFCDNEDSDTYGMPNNYVDGCENWEGKDGRSKMNDYYTELANRDKATKPVRIVGTEEISCRCPNDNYEVGWGVPGEELDLMYSFCPECGQRIMWEG